MTQYLHPYISFTYKRLKYGEPRCSRSSSTKRCSSSHKRARIANRCSSCRRKSTAEIPLRLPAERLAGFVFFLISQKHICFGLNRLGHRAPRRFIRDAAENVTSFAVSFLLLYYFYFFTSLYCRELCFGYFLDSSIKSKASREGRVRGRPSVVRARRSEPAARTVVRGAAENPQLPTRIVPEVIVVVKTTAACLRYHVEALVLLVSDNIHYRLIGIARISCQLYMVNICE